MTLAWAASITGGKILEMARDLLRMVWGPFEVSEAPWSVGSVVGSAWSSGLIMVVGTGARGLLLGLGASWLWKWLLHRSHLPLPLPMWGAAAVVGWGSVPGWLLLVVCRELSQDRSAAPVHMPSSMASSKGNQWATQCRALS
jgi:hypothetical protein